MSLQRRSHAIIESLEHRGSVAVVAITVSALSIASQGFHCRDEIDRVGLREEEQTQVEQEA